MKDNLIKENSKQKQDYVEGTEEEIWQSPKIEVLPVPDITKSGAGNSVSEGIFYSS